jgi:methyl-accepting chemotaxis protein
VSKRGRGIQTKMLLAFAVVLALLAIVGVTGVFGLRSVRDGYHSMIYGEIEVLEGLLEFEGTTMTQMVAARGYSLTGDEAEKTWYKSMVDKADSIIQRLDPLMAEFGSNVDTAWVHEAWTDLLTLYDELRYDADALIAAHDRGDEVAAEALMEAADTSLEAFHADIQTSVENIRTHLDAEDASLNKSSGSTISLMIGAAVVSVVAGTIMALTMSRAISKPLVALASAASQAATGDLTISVPEVKTRDEVHALAEAFSSMIASLVSVIGEASQSADEVAATSEELSSTSEEISAAAGQLTKTAEEMSKASQQQSESATSTASSMTQLTAAVDQVAKGAQSQMEAIQVTTEALRESEAALKGVEEMLGAVDQDASQNVKAAVEGRKAVNDLVESMDRVRTTTESASTKISELNQLSADITSIVKVIDDIASQTNLLALNAAIEAARAGEYGRGFAVVADEVRKLAERSLVETKSISDVIERVRKAVDATVQAIETSVREVEAGSAVAQQAGASLESILSGATATQEVVKRLEDATDSLGKSSRTFDEALTRIVSVTEENSAATEEMAASTRSVQELVDSVASVSEETAAATEETLASTEQMSQSVTQVADSAQSLAAMAQRLQDALNKFKI